MPDNPFADLPTFEIDINPVECPAFWEDEETDATRDLRVGIEDNRRSVHLEEKYRIIDSRQTAIAHDFLDPLPELGEALEGLQSGNFNSWDVVPAVYEILGPIQRLHVCTLAFNQRIQGKMLQMLDSGQIQEMEFVCSTFFQSKQVDKYAVLQHALTSRGQRCCAMRSHAKILLFRFVDGTIPVVAYRASANLCSSNNIEQFTLSRNQSLYDFHAAWIESALDEVHGPRTKADPRGDQTIARKQGKGRKRKATAPRSGRTPG